MNSIEVLSPAGEFESLKCAVNNGADAVYLGGSQFSARKSAVNFTNEQIEEAVKYAHLYGVKVYVALNTLIHENELNDVYSFVKFCCDTGVDALIVQDLGVLYMIKRYFPQMRIHASTQMTVHNLYGARFVKKLGFERVVVSRELPFDEIKHIIDGSDIEVEVFVHGALCMCYSGQCLMSSLIGGRSGNRGTCAQPCRLPYTICDKDKTALGASDKYYMSLKDLCTVDEIKKFIDIGVTSLKIEGRMKSNEYVAIVTALYNKYRNGDKADKDDIKLLENIFSRSGFTKGYLYGDTGAHMLNMHKHNDNVYRDIEQSVHDYAQKLIGTKKHIKIDAYVSVKLGSKPYIIFKHGENTITKYGDELVQAAVKTATAPERIVEQVMKTGSSPFEITNITYDIDEGINIPIKVINELRRNATEQLESRILNHNVRGYLPYDYIKANPVTTNYCKSAYVKTYLQAKAAYQLGFGRIYISFEVYALDKQFFDKNKEVFCLMLPNIANDSYIDKCLECELDSVCISNISHIELFSNKRLCANYTMNIYNSMSQKLLSQLGISTVCLSPELNIRQLTACACDMENEILVYGKIQLMTVKNCLLKSCNGKCGCDEQIHYIKDRKGVYFPLFLNKQTCTNSIYNSVPVYMGDRVDELKTINASWLRFDFVDETPEQMKRIVEDFEKGIKMPEGTFTRGHYYRGVL